MTDPTRARCEALVENIVSVYCAEFNEFKLCVRGVPLVDALTAFVREEVVADRLTRFVALPVDDRCKRIVQALRPTDEGSWEINQQYVKTELEGVRRETLEQVAVQYVASDRGVFEYWLDQQAKETT